MPIYEFHCNDCGHDFNDLVLSSRKPTDIICKNCQSGNIIKLMSSAAIQSGHCHNMNHCPEKAAGHCCCEGHCHHHH